MGWIRRLNGLLNFVASYYIRSILSRILKGLTNLLRRYSEEIVLVLLVVGLCRFDFDFRTG